MLSLYYDRFCKLIVYMISRVLDNYDTAAAEVAYHGDILSAVTAEREEKCAQLLVIDIQLFYLVYLSNVCVFEIHRISPFFAVFIAATVSVSRC